MKNIKGYEGKYMATEDGQIFSVKSNKFLKLQTVSNGYLMVSLFKNGVDKYCLVHRLIGETFLPKPEGCNVVNHLDGDKKNNNIENLEWTTQSENVRACKARYKMYNIPLYQFDKNNNIVYTYKSYYEAAAVNDITLNTLLKHIKNNKSFKNEKWFSPNKDYTIKFDKFVPSTKSRPVLKYSLDGEFIEEYTSTFQAAKQTGLHQTGIYACCVGRYKTTGGFIFKFKHI